jgi:Secretion system C-terminal sorting domain
LTVNGRSVIRRLNEITEVPNNCPECSISVIDDNLAFLSKKKRDEDNLQVKMDLVPNPTSGKFRLKMNAPKEIIEAIEIYNATGVLIKTLNADQEIDLEAEPNGVYICRVRTSQGQLLIAKVFKQD